MLYISRDCPSSILRIHTIFIKHIHNDVEIAEKLIWIPRGDHVKLSHSVALDLYREEHTAHCRKAQYHLEHRDCFHLVAAPQHHNGNKRANNPANSTRKTKDKREIQPFFWNTQENCASLH
jgi:hypothetical protein